MQRSHGEFLQDGLDGSGARRAGVRLCFCGKAAHRRPLADGNAIRPVTKNTHNQLVEWGWGRGWGWGWWRCRREHRSQSCGMAVLLTVVSGGGVTATAVLVLSPLNHPPPFLTPPRPFFPQPYIPTVNRHKSGVCGAFRSVEAQEAS